MKKKRDILGIERSPLRLYDVYSMVPRSVKSNSTTATALTSVTPDSQFSNNRMNIW